MATTPKAGGMDPVTLSIIMSSLMGGLGGLFGGGSDENPDARRPFEGDLEAQSMLDRTRNVTNGALEAYGDQLGRGVKLRSSYAQTPPTYTGGGLPFPIGVNAQDPALADRSLLELPGVDFNGFVNNWETRPRNGQPGAPGVSPPDTSFPNGQPAPSAGAGGSEKLSTGPALRSPSEASYRSPRTPSGGSGLSEEDLIALKLLGSAQ